MPEKTDTQTIMTDSVVVGILVALSKLYPLGIEVVPQKDLNGQVSYRVSGKVDDALKIIYENRPLGARDALEGVKSARSMLFLIRRGGQSR